LGRKVMARLAFFEPPPEVELVLEQPVRAIAIATPAAATAIARA
jgi:hypothetical protein